MGQVRATLTIHGRVQGVCFRMYTQERAQQLGLTGWVRNTWGRTVETVFEGEEADVRSMVRWCGSGPPHADVSKVDVDYSGATGEFTDFRVAG